MAAVLSRNRVALVGALVLVASCGGGGDHQDCAATCEIEWRTFGCFDELGGECADVPTCTDWCETNPDITTDLLDCLAARDVLVDYEDKNMDPLRPWLIARRPHCEDLLGLPDTGTEKRWPNVGVGTTGTVTTTTTTTTPTNHRAGIPVDIDGTWADGTNPRLQVFYGHNLGENASFNQVVLIGPVPAMPGTVDLPEVTIDLMGQGLPYIQGVFAAISVFDDLDDNGVQDPDEPLLAWAEPYPLFIDFEGPDGEGPGWHLASWENPALAPTGQGIAITDIDRPVVLQPLVLVDQVAFAGTHGSPGTGLLADGLATMNMGEPPALTARYWDQPLPALNDPFSLQIVGPPSADRLIQTGGTPATVELLVAYSDDDGSGDFTPGVDALTAGICASATEGAAARWVDLPRSVYDFWDLWYTGTPFGWSAAAFDGSGNARPLGPTEAASLYTATPIEGDCAP